MQGTLKARLRFLGRACKGTTRCEIALLHNAELLWRDGAGVQVSADWAKECVEKPKGMIEQLIIH